jgi:hypothetical protein
MFGKKNVSRKSQFTYWLSHDAKDCGLMQPPCKDALALQFIKDYLLGEDWYVVNPVNHEQCNTQLVHEILYKYSKEYRKEYKRAIKRGANK